MAVPPSDPASDGDPDLQHVGRSLDRVLRNLRAPDTRATGAVFGRWEAVVGPSIAAHARPVKLEDGRLVVEVDDPAWATQLRFLEADLVNRLSEAGGLAVTRVDVRVKRR